MFGENDENNNFKPQGQYRSSIDNWPPGLNNASESKSHFLINHLWMDLAPWCYKRTDEWSPGGVNYRAPYGAKESSCNYEDG